MAVGRKPVRKLPAVPNSKQAHIVQLKTEPKKSSRALPKPPDENPSPKKGGLRLTNFFRSVKFPKNKKIQPAPVRIFGRDLGELAKATNLEGNITCLFTFASCLLSLLLPIYLYLAICNPLAKFSQIARFAHTIFIDMAQFARNRI